MGLAVLSASWVCLVGLNAHAHTIIQSGLTQLCIKINVWIATHQIKQLLWVLEYIISIKWMQEMSFTQQSIFK